MNNIYLTAFSTNVISFVAGSALTWSSPVVPKLKDISTTPFEDVISVEEGSWISSLTPLGAAVGPFLYGLILSDRIGRRFTLLLMGVPFLISYILLATLSHILIVYYVTRFIIGTSVGGVFTVVPTYFGEIPTKVNRGAVGTSMNLFVCFGIFFSYCVGPYVSIPIFNAIPAVLSAIFFVLFYLYGTETPQYLIGKGKIEDAKTALVKLRGGDTKDVDDELAELEMKIKEEVKGSLFEIFRSKALTKAFIISVGLAAFQQLSGINAVLFYTQTIFESAGSDLEPAISSIIVGGVQFGISFIVPFIADLLGRKILLVISSIGMAVAEIPLGVYSFLKDRGDDVSSVSFLPILCMVVNIITYNLGLGPLPWAVMGELFPSNVKSIASTITASSCWFLAFIITKYFEALSDAIGMGPSFWIFSVFCVISVPFCLFYVVETKGKSVYEIQKILI